MLWKLENAGEDQQSPPRGRITTTGGSPSNCARPPAEREDAGTRSQNHCSGNIPYPIRCFLRNKKRKIPGNKVTFISALESTPAGWPQGWHFQWALKRGILPWDWYKRKQISRVRSSPLTPLHTCPPWGSLLPASCQIGFLTSPFTWCRSHRAHKPFPMGCRLGVCSQGRQGATLSQAAPTDLGGPPENIPVCQISRSSFPQNPYVFSCPGSLGDLPDLHSPAPTRAEASESLL